MHYKKSCSIGLKSLYLFGYQLFKHNSNLEVSYKLILEELQKILGKDNLHYKPIRPKLSDIELISLIILAEFKSIDSEYQLFRELKCSFLENKVERSVYNRRKRKLFPFVEEIRMKMVQKFNEFENYFVMNSSLWRFIKSLVHREVKFVKRLIMPCPIKSFVPHRTSILWI